jgi:hypothetical protein
MTFDGNRKIDGHSAPGADYFCVSAPVFPELIAIDEEIRSMRLTLEKPELNQRHRRGFEGLLNDCLKKRRKLLEGAKKRP